MVRKRYNADNMNTRYKKGFTLVELLVVIAIIGILATLLLLQLNTARGKARDTKRIGDITQIRTAVELFYDECGLYPQDVYAAGTDCAGGVGKFMASGAVPKDPSTQAPYGYGKNANPATKYQISAELENQNANALGTDSDIDGSGWGNVNGAIETCTSAANDCVFDLGIK